MQIIKQISLHGIIHLYEFTFYKYVATLLQKQPQRG